MKSRFPVLAVVLAALVATGACGGETAQLDDAGISANDVPQEWLPTDLDEESGQDLWDTLPLVLQSDSAARLLIDAFEAESGLHGAATLLIEADDAAAIPAAIESETMLSSLGRLLEEESDLLLPNPRGGDPNAYFAVSETPVPGSIRSRLIRLMEDDLVHADSLTFNVGNVLAVVTIWYPEAEGPAQDINAIAEDVESRLQAVADS